MLHIYKLHVKDSSRVTLNEFVIVSDFILYM